MTVEQFVAVMGALTALLIAIAAFNGVPCFNVLGGIVGGGYANSQAHANALGTAVLGRFTSSGLKALSATTTSLDAAAAVRLVRALVARRQRARGRAPPRRYSSGMWAVLPDWQAQRIAVCVRGTDRIGPPTPRREYTGHPGSALDCPACSRRAYSRGDQAPLA